MHRCGSTVAIFERAQYGDSRSRIRSEIAGFFVLVISSNSMDSENVQQELTIALDQNKPLIPLIYSRARIPEQLDHRLRQYQQIDFRRGGYDQNFADLVAGLVEQGVVLHATPEADPDEIAERRRQHLGEPVKVQWGEVLSKVPRWALAWGLGWAVYWLVIPVVITMITGTPPGDEDGSLVLFPFAGLVGGIFGGLLAGTVTMLVLRRHASSIAWKHISPSIRVWGLIGPVGTVIATGLALLLAEGPSADAITDFDCSGLNFGECIVGAAGQAIGAVLVSIFILVLAVLVFVLLTLFLIGAVAGGMAVRHIRRLEPGILGRQAIWIVLAWGAGAVLAGLAPLAVVASIQRA